MAILNEKSKNAFLYLTIAAIIILVIFLIYIFQVNHKYNIDDNAMWSNLFKNAGFNSTEILNITHDDDTWYYKGLSTCVGYGNSQGSLTSHGSHLGASHGSLKTRCTKSDYYCGGGDIVGTPKQQVQAVKDAILNGGEHILCPRIYYALQ